MTVTKRFKKNIGETKIEKERLQELYDLWLHDCGSFIEDAMPHMLEVKSAPFHKELYDAMYSNLRCLFVAPRGHAKSRVCSVFYPIHEALFGIRKNIHIISASETVAIEFLRLIKTELETNDYIHKLFGKQKSNKWSETHIILKNGASILAKGAEAQSRGPRPDLIILDDIETEESVESKDRIRKLRTWLFKACINSLTPMGQCVWIGTVINHSCLLYDTFETKNGWTKLKFQAYQEGVEDEEHVLWPKLWSHAKLQEKKAEIGSTFFASEYQNNPVDNDSLPIKRDMIRYWDKLPDQYNMYMTVDPAYSEDKTADFKSCSLIAVDEKDNRYLVRYIHTHDPQGEFNNAIINMWQQNKRKVVALGIPNSGVEKSFYRQFLDECVRSNISPPVKELKNVVIDGQGKARRRKSARTTAALQHLFEQGKYYIHESHKEAEEELLNIGISKHDDLSDTLTYCEQLIDPYLVPMQFKEEYESDVVQLNQFNRNGTFGYGI